MSLAFLDASPEVQEYWKKREKQVDYNLANGLPMYDNMPEPPEPEGLLTGDERWWEFWK